MKKPKIIGLNTTFASLNYPNWIETGFSESVSLLDYEAVVVNPAELLREYGYKSAEYKDYRLLSETCSRQIAADFHRVYGQVVELLRNGKNIFVILNAPDVFRIRENSGAKYSFFDCFSFLPVQIRIENLKGHELITTSEPPYDLYFRKNKDALFYECVIERLSSAVPLANIRGTSKLISAYVEYGHGKIIFLPPVKLEGDVGTKAAWEVNGSRFIESIMELHHALSAPSETNELPSWTENFHILNELEAIRLKHQSEVEMQKLKEKIEAEQKAIDNITNYKRLLTETGEPLENIVKQVLSELGFELCMAEEKRSDVIAKYNNIDIVAEIKGVGKSAAEKHAAQLEKWASQFLIDHGHQPRALLIVNGYNTLPLDQRTEEVFPDQMLKYSTSREQTLITTTQLLCLFVEIQEHPDCKEERIQELLSTTGRYTRYTDYSEFIAQSIKPKE